VASCFSEDSNHGGGDLAATPGAQPHVFTWLLPEHQECAHKPGEIVAVQAGGRKRAFCKSCNLLLDPPRHGVRP
jgi:hypothetical protein